MRFQCLILFLLLGLLCPHTAGAQVKPKAKDSAAMYKKIEKYSTRTKFTKALHKLIFEPTKQKTANPLRRPKKLKYKSYEGKIIRNINIQTLDPFGYSEADTTRKPRNWGERSGNRLHIKSRKLAIKNLLLLKRNRPLDSLLVKESERLIRTQRYISRVAITAEPTAKNSDSVDVYIRVVDSWSLIPKASISSTRSNFELDERNFLGSGHEFDNNYTTRLADGKAAFKVRYTIPNILNTFIRTSFLYQNDLDGNYGKSINIERPFYSPFTKWAGGVYLDQQLRKDSLQDKNLAYSIQRFKYNSHDFWGGHSIRIFNDNTEDDRTTNLILSGRFLDVDFTEKPDAAYDTIRFYSDEQFYMGGIGIASRQFVEDKYLFNNGIVEDVPVGKIYGITGGYQHKNGRWRLYAGGRVAYGNYFKWGYLSANLEYGTFFRDSKAEQTAFSFQANYFTNLIELGKWKMRQFIKPQLILGSNRLDSNADYLTLNESTGFSGTYGAGFQGNNSAGIRGFNSAIYGTKKLVMTFQTQFYSPWNVIGFRINPYFNYTAAVLGNERIGITKSKMYSKIGAGVIISNDYLVFSSFQLSVAYYPSIPGEGDNLLKTNSFDNEDFGLQDFDFGKPRTVIFK